jgi:hypothetical protein
VNNIEYIENKIKENSGKTAEIKVVDINEILVEWYKKLNYKHNKTDKLVDGTINCRLTHM